MWLVPIVNSCYQDLTVSWVFPQLTAHAGSIKTKHSVNRIISCVKKPHWNLSCQRNDTETFETFWLLYDHKLEHAKHKHIHFITHRNTYVHKNVNLNFKRLHGKSIMFVPEWNWKDPQNIKFRGKFIVTDFTACWSDVKCFFLYFRRFADVEVNGLLGLVERETVEPRWGH